MWSLINGIWSKQFSYLATKVDYDVPILPICLVILLFYNKVSLVCEKALKYMKIRKKKIKNKLKLKKNIIFTSEDGA